MNVVLDELREVDFPTITGWIDPGVFRIFSAPVDDSQLRRLLTHRRGDTLTDIGKKALDGDTGELVGLVHAVVNVRDNHAHIQQIVVAPGLRGRGYGAAILRRFLDLCFLEHRFHRVQLLTDETNVEAIACYRKVGFHVDGLLRDISKVEDGYVSEYFFSMLDQEWRRIRGEMTS